MGRRAETTEYLKECIADALISLMCEKPLAKIKIEEITDHAKVGRVTYFRNFDSKTDVLIFKLLLLWQRWELQNPIEEPKTYYQVAYRFFAFCLSIRPLMETLYQNELQNVLLSALTEYVFSPQAPATVSKQYIETFLIYGMFGFVTEWVARGFLESPETLAKLISFNTPDNPDHPVSDHK